MKDELLKIIDYYQIPYEEKIICPFHGDVNPSLKLNIDENFWFCFGCQEGGNAYKFHKKMQELKGEKNEIKILASYERILKGKTKNKEKIILPKVQKKNPKFYRQKLIEAKDYFYGLKKINWIDIDKNKDVEVLDYMMYRGFKRSTLNRFDAKLTYKDDTYPIIFPIKDNGRFKGWVCRTIDPEINKKRKYLYNEGFRRVNTLAGNYKDTEIVMLVEGYFDMIKARQLGIKKVAAVLGWKLTDKQIMKLKAQGVKTIISALDNDKCGEKGTIFIKKYFKMERFPYPKHIKDMGDMDKEELKKIKDKFTILQEVM